MSNSLAIAAVTGTLWNLLDNELTSLVPGTIVTTKPPDKARDGNSGDGPNQVNLFLYQANQSAAWRNIDMPRQVRPGETAHPPLALDLDYLITAYGAGDEDRSGHRLLGQAMRVLHDHPVLSRDEVEQALPESQLHNQVERVRITPQPLSVDEMSKLWTTFQTQYRVSAAYRVSVVLIESVRATRAPLPVLTRGPADEGVRVQPDLTPPFPTLESIQVPDQQPSAHLGNVLTLTGHHLEGDSVLVRFTNSRLEDPIEVSAQPGGTSTTITVALPDEPAEWVAGIYSVVSVISRAGEPDRTTNALPLSVAPRILDATAERADDTVTLTVTCSPEIRPAQRAALLLDGREVLAEDHAAQTDTLTFIAVGAPAGKHYVRLRLDGVDSLLVDRTQTPPVFDESQTVTIP